MKKLVLLSAALIGLLTSCKKENNIVSPDPNSASLNSGTTQKAQSSPIKWSTGSINVAKVKFVGKINHITYSQETSSVAGTVNLFGPIPLGFNDYTLPSGPWTQAQVTVTVANNTSAPAMTLTGDYTNSTTTIPVVFHLEEGMELKSDDMRGVTISNNALASFKADEMEAYSEDIAVSQVAGATLSGGAIIISSTSNTSLYNAIVEKLHGNH
jgi:hypothetical protein